jgi:hypothetical protein
MAARSEPAAALVALGARLRAAGAAPAREPAHGTHEIAAGVARLRALLSGEPEAPEALTREQLAAYAARYAPRNAQRALGRSSGWAAVPQCGGCKAFLKYPGAQCSACGFMDGGGYLAVPAKTSHLERWR